MPVAVRSLGAALSRLNYRTITTTTTAKRKPPCRQSPSAIYYSRTFSSVPWRLTNGSPGDSGVTPPKEEDNIILEDLDIKDLDKYSPTERAELRNALRGLLDPNDPEPFPEVPDETVAQEVRNIDSTAPMPSLYPEPVSRQHLGVLGMDEEDEFARMPEDEVDGSDMTSVAHSELDLHRDIREYQRRMAWDLPLLSSMSSDL